MKQYIKYVGILALALFLQDSQAQINTLDAQYFHNPYLANPAMAGTNEGISAQVATKQQWSNLPGAPSIQYLTLNYGYDRLGLGLGILNEKEGDFIRTKILASYAYHLPLSETQKLSFGLNLSLQTGSLNLQNITNPNDPSALDYDNREMTLDGDFGVAYTNNKFSLQAAYYRLKGQLSKDLANTADYDSYYLSGSYQLSISSELNLNNKIVYRSVPNAKDILDFATQLITADEKLGLTLVHHNTKSFSAGLSYNHNQKMEFIGFYHTAPKALKGIVAASFEVGLKMNFKNRE